ncbi:MAG TPA: class I SAM-dependent methyltransferase [Candidatus Deferrimicrobiaceae bacterium]|jgi:ubiquinone/menaquinone biosynthesis C-methylase UbiE
MLTREVSVNARTRIEENMYQAPTEWRLLGAKTKAANIILLSQRNNVPHRKILEVGAGDGAILKWLDAFKFSEEAHALEVDPSGVDVIKSLNLASVRKVSLFDGYALPYDDDAFDLVVLSHVLEHVEFERILLREIKRVSRFQVIEIPLDSIADADRAWQHLYSYGHINAYTPALLRFLLKTERFGIVDDLAGIQSCEVKEYLHFVYNKIQRTPENVAGIREQAARNEIIFNSLPRSEQEWHAEYYAVLTKKISARELFDENLALAVSYYNNNKLGDAKLVLGNLNRLSLDGLFPLPAWAEALLRGES